MTSRIATELRNTLFVNGLTGSDGKLGGGTEEWCICHQLNDDLPPKSEPRKFDFLDVPDRSRFHAEIANPCGVSGELS